MIPLSSSSYPRKTPFSLKSYYLQMKPHTSKSPLTMLIAPHTTKFFPKLHHQLCPPSHFHSQHIQISQTKPRIITTHNHRKPHTPISVASEENDVGRRITTSDEVVNKRTSGFDWKDFDVVTAAAVVGMHLLCGFAPFTFNWQALQVAIGLILVSHILGINVSFHRHLSHKSFKIPKWLEYTFAYCGTQALQGNPIDWVRTHRYHHQYSDTERDPYGRIKGFWYGHVLWMFDAKNIRNMLKERNNVRDLEKQLFYRFLSKTYIIHPIAFALVLHTFEGLPFVVWGMGVRIVWVYHMTWLVNSIGHSWGNQTWRTKDLSRNSRWMGILAYGDGWHNNHHAFEYSARHGLEWWQVDIVWYVIRFLEIIGLASDVKLPTAIDIQRKTPPLNDPSP